jgi:hypothetical protein
MQWAYFTLKAFKKKKRVRKSLTNKITVKQRPGGRTSRAWRTVPELGAYWDVQQLENNDAVQRERLETFCPVASQFCISLKRVCSLAFEKLSSCIYFVHVLYSLEFCS